jgi:hypothetical protein
MDTKYIFLFLGGIFLYFLLKPEIVFNQRTITLINTDKPLQSLKIYRTYSCREYARPINGEQIAQLEQDGRFQFSEVSTFLNFQMPYHMNFLEVIWVEENGLKITLDNFNNGSPALSKNKEIDYELEKKAQQAWNLLKKQPFYKFELELVIFSNNKYPDVNWIYILQHPEVYEKVYYQLNESEHTGEDLITNRHISRTGEIESKNKPTIFDDKEENSNKNPVVGSHVSVHSINFLSTQAFNIKTTQDLNKIIKENMKPYVWVINYNHSISEYQTGTKLNGFEIYKK